MSLTITMNKVFGLRLMLVLIAVGSVIGAYKYGYNKGLTDMARYAATIMKDLPQSSPDESAPNSVHRPTHEWGVGSTK